ncbi:hypothetical protein OROMI_032699 [Orobanche minor]
MAARKVAVIGLFAALVVAAATIAAVFLIQKKHHDDDRIRNSVNDSQKAIRDLCRNTYYQETCINTLSKATNASDPKTLIEAGFRAAIQELGRVITETGALQEAANDPLAAGAYRTCRKLLDDSISDLQTTVDEMSTFDMTNFRILVDDIKTWLTGALTYQETCLDCFEDVRSDAGVKMKELLELSRELTINGLALANEISNFEALTAGLGIGRRLMASMAKPRDYDYDYDYRGKPGARRLSVFNHERKDYDYDYDYRGKPSGRKLTQALANGNGDYDYGSGGDYDYRGKPSGRKLTQALTNGNGDYDYGSGDYDYRGKPSGRKLTQALANGNGDYDYGSGGDYDYRGKPSGRKLTQALTNGNGDYDYGSGDYDYVYRGRRTAKSPQREGTRHLLQAGPGSINPDVIVAKDGSGKYRTINEALQEAPQKHNGTFVIYIKEGVYEEYVTVNKTTWSVMFIGDGPTKTKIIGNRSKIGGWGTFWTATVAIEGDNFIAKDIGFANNAGPDMHQAVALRVSADKSIFHNCRIDGFQDTLYAHNHRQYYRDCTISGTIDFIFGNARAVLQNCTLLIRKPLENQKLCMVTAQGRTLVNQTSAVVLQNCRIMPGGDYPVEDKSYRAYLGRPWKEFSRTIVMDSQIDGLINPDGWSSWNESSAHLDTCWYTEVNNNGPGADVTRRVKWPGIKSVSIEEAKAFTPGEYMVGDSWIADKGIPYDSGRMAS